LKNPSGMDEKILIDQIKRKEQDIIKTLQNIAEAALTNICIDESFQTSRDSIGNPEMDDNQVDSDLNKVANEIAKSNSALLDDNSEPDFEDIIDDAVEISDCHSELIGRDQTQCLEDSEKDVNEPVNPSTAKANMLPEVEDEMLTEGCQSGQYLSNTVQNDASPDMQTSCLDHKMMEWSTITQSPSASQASTSSVNTQKTVPQLQREEKEKIILRNDIKPLSDDIKVLSEGSKDNILEKKAPELVALDDRSLLNKLKDLSPAVKIKEDNGTSLPKKYEQGLHIPTELPSLGNNPLFPSRVENQTKELNEKTVSNQLIKSNDQHETEAEDEGYTHNDEESDLTDAAENAGSWKIDYIRVETEETNNAKRSNFKNEKWNTCKSKRDKQSRKRREQKLESPGKQMKKIKRKEHFNNTNLIQKQSEKKKETTAMRLDKANMNKSRESSSKTSQNVSRQVKTIKEWHKVIELSDISEKSSVKQQIYYDTLEPYSPTVPRGTSQRCIDALSASDLEMLSCPACQDRFFMPTTFFQHVHRKSVNINYECKTCDKILVFQNKCSLKIHILSHLEVDEKSKVRTDMLSVMSLNDSDLQMNSDVRNLKNELKNTMKDIFSHEETKDRCLECHEIIKSDAMGSHFSDLSDGVDLSLKCQTCDKHFPTRCSLFAHKKIHKKMSPYVCPECGIFFYTWSYFKSHVRDVCMHEKRKLMWLCPTCPDLEKFAGDKFETIQHIADTHIKKYCKCDLCPSAFPNQQKLSNHISLKHKDKKSEDHFVKHLYKTQLNQKSLFFSSKKALTEHLESTVEIESCFVFNCDSCQSNFWTSTDLLSHSMSCVQKSERSELFPDETIEDSNLTEMLDNLKQIQDDSQCSSCLKYNENFQKHIERHQRNIKDNLKVEVRAESETKEPEDKGKPRLTRNMKRRISSTDENSKKLKIEEAPISEPVAMASPPLRLKIKLTPEIAKSIDSATIASVTPVKTTNLRQKSHKVKFNVPPKKEPMVESLGIDVPSGKDLILLNRLFHSPDAFANGSIVAARPESDGYSCSVCIFTETSREVFQSHISQHKLCQGYFQCKECGACFAAEPSWKKHLLLIHRVKNPTPEDYCQDLAINNLLPLFPEGERDPYEFDDSGSETGNLVIDTGEDYPEYSRLISSANTPTKCLACNAQMATTSQLREHRCSAQSAGKITVNR